MTVKDAMNLKRGDRVGLTHDDRPWTVTQVHRLGRRDVEIVIEDADQDELRLRSAAALRSLKAIAR